MELEIINTGDQTPTLFNAQLNETYHSVHGALQESVHVYIKSGLSQFKDKKKVRVFEMGFGTGLNVWLTWLFTIDYKIKIDFVTVELAPLPIDVWSKLSYTNDTQKYNMFRELHSVPWEEENELSEYFSLQKIEISLLKYQNNEKFDLIYFDAFAPDKQPELWEVSVFETLFGMLNQGGALVTYSAKGQVRRNMQQAGFTVEKIPGPPGKREMLRAVRL